MSFDKISTENFNPNQNFEQIRLECQALAKSRAKISAGAAIIPLPMVDAAIDVAMLSKLLPQISARFGLEYVDDQKDTESSQNLTDRVIALGSLFASRSIVKQAVQGFGGRFIGKQVSKYVPLGGQIVAATLGYMIFKKITFDHIDECYKTAKKAQQEQAQNQTQPL